MHLSLEWISDYVDLSNLDAEEIADKITLYCAEVEGYETVTRAIGDARIGRITEAERVGTELSKITVDCGTEQYQTVS